jgi:SNF2 family DNA or RNA helicase
MIKVGFDKKTLRLVMSTGFSLNDVIRGFPSRRFDPKSKTWRVPLVAANIRHFNETKHLYPYVLDEAAAGAVQDFEFLTAKPVHIPFPRSYDFSKAKVPYEPKAHQWKMLDHSWNLPRSGWIAKMGTGKTFAAIHLAFQRWRAGQIDAAVIICPSTLRTVWKKELAKFATDEYEYLIHETKSAAYDWFIDSRPKDKLQFLAVSAEGLGVSEKLYQSACKFYLDRRVMSIADESSRFKNPSAKRTERAITMGAASTYTMILNGTPIAVGLEDLYSQMEFVDPNIIGMGDYWAFRSRYLEFGGYEARQIVGYKNTEELMDKVKPYMCEVGKDALDLPPKVMVERPVTISPEQKKLLRLIVKGSTGDPNDPLIKVENALEKVLRCRQVVGGWLPRGIPKVTIIDGEEVEEIDTVMEPLASNPKLDAMLEMIDDAYATSKFTIWSTFVHEIEQIAAVLRAKYGDRAAVTYYGKTNMEDRSTAEDRYCNDPSMRFFIGNPTAAGLGLTLIGDGFDDVAVYYSGTNAFIDRAQSEDRNHRLGQKNTVTVVDMVATGTVDELILASIVHKMSIEEFVYTQIKKGIRVDDLLMGEGT